MLCEAGMGSIRRKARIYPGSLSSMDLGDRCGCYKVVEKENQLWH